MLTIVGALIAGTLAASPSSGLQSPAGQASPRPAVATSPAKSTPHKLNLGDWLEKHKNLPLDQQQKALENDPDFKRRPLQVQKSLRAVLAKFNSSTPEQRDRMIKRMKLMGSLPADQRKKVHDAQKQLQELPNERRAMVRKTLRDLQHMPADQRKNLMESQQFRTTFSDEEQKILQQLSAIAPPRAANAEPSNK